MVHIHIIPHITHNSLHAVFEHVFERKVVVIHHHHYYYPHYHHYRHNHGFLGSILKLGALVLVIVGVMVILAVGLVLYLLMRLVRRKKE